MHVVKKIISYNEIQKAIRLIANNINCDFKDGVVLVCNLKGGFRCFCDLIYYLKILVEIDFIDFSSYVGGKSSGNVEIIKDLKIDIKDKDVVIVDDIIDTGLTIKSIVEYLYNFKYPKTVSVCALLSKDNKRVKDVPVVRYKGFNVEDKFVIGYGLDYNEQYRHLNNIYILGGI